MKLRAAVLIFAACCFLAASPVWAISSICDAVPGNLVTNCGFETEDFSGWIQSGNTSSTGVDGNEHSGENAAFLGPFGSDGFLTQFVGNNSTSYTVSFYLMSEGGAPNNFTVFWNGVDIGPDLVDAGFFDYVQFSQQLAGNSGAGSNNLTFAFQQVPAFWWLDDVVVTGAGTPEPGTLVLLGTGLIGAIGAFRRKINL